MSNKTRPHHSQMIFCSYFVSILGFFLKIDTVNAILSWWDLQYLWQNLDFTDVTQGTIYMDFDAEVNKETLQHLIDYFLTESQQESSIHAHELWQKNIAKDLFDLHYGLDHPRLKKIKVVLRER